VPAAGWNPAFGLSILQPIHRQGIGHVVDDGISIAEHPESRAESRQAAGKKYNGGSGRSPTFLGRIRSCREAEPGMLEFAVYMNERNAK